MSIRGASRVWEGWPCRPWLDGEGSPGAGTQAPWAVGRCGGACLCPVRQETFDRGAWDS